MAPYWGPGPKALASRLTSLMDDPALGKGCLRDPANVQH